MGALEADALTQSAHRVVLAGFVEPVTTQAAEARAALEDAERHAFARRRAALESGDGDEGRALAALEGFADRRSWLHALSIERGPARAAGPLLSGAGPNATRGTHPRRTRRRRRFARSRGGRRPRRPT